MAFEASAITDNALLQSLKMSLNTATIRHQAIASNIANVNTPGYKRIDLSPSFQTEFQTAMKQLKAGKTLDSTPRATLAEIPHAGLTRFDGNNVDIDKEMIELMDNQSKYEFAAKMLTQNYSAIRAAITGRSGG